MVNIFFNAKKKYFFVYVLVVQRRVVGLVFSWNNNCNKRLVEFYENDRKLERFV